MKLRRAVPPLTCQLAIPASAGANSLLFCPNTLFPCGLLNLQHNRNLVSSQYAPARQSIKSEKQQEAPPAKNAAGASNPHTQAARFSNQFFAPAIG
jgi:hypothetical protein